MKRIVCLLLTAALVLALCACSGGGKDPEPTKTPDPTADVTAEPIGTPEPSGEPQPSEEPACRSPLTGLPMDEALADRKPVAIMLNNIKAAMPQQGNSGASIIYEVLAEGGITRMLGVYEDIGAVGLIGSVRSARLYYLELALGHDAVFVHAGGSPEFYDYQGKWNVTTADGVNGPYSGAGLFWRDRERIAGHYYAYEHSLLTSGEKLEQILSAKGLLSAHTAGYVYEMTFADDGTPADGQAAEVITVPFSGSKTTTFRYDGGSGLYLAEQYGGAMVDGNDDTQISAANVLILRTQCTVVDDAGRLTVDLSEGEGWFACGGQLIPIRWEKGGRNDQLRYFTADGQPLTLGRGRSYVCIIPLAREITVE